MKVVAIFGEDELASYKRFRVIVDQVVRRGWEHISVGSNSSLSEILASGSLFSGERLVSVSAAHKISAKEYEWLKKHNEEYEGRLLLYFPNSISAAIKKNLPKDTVYEEFKLKKELFIFLETLYPGNGKNALRMFHSVIKVDAVELVLAMMGRHLRDLTFIKTNEAGFNAPTWRMQKLKRQADKFTLDQFREFVGEVAEADIKSKTGLGDLSTLLDLILIKL